MPYLNRVTLMGHLSSEPETKPAGDSTVTKFNLAVTERWKDKDEKRQEHTNWIPVAYWNGGLPAFIKKGTLVIIEGSIRVTQYEEGGNRKYYTEVRATNVVCLEKKQDQQSTLPVEPPPPTNSRRSTARPRAVS